MSFDSKGLRLKLVPFVGSTEASLREVTVVGDHRSDDVDRGSQEIRRSYYGVEIRIQ
jgi:hypothetical protein